MGQNRFSYSRSVAAAHRGGLQKVRRYDGLQKTSRVWDGLRRDEELWTKDGDCLIHLYTPRSSRRGPSFRVPLKLLEQPNTSHLLEKWIHKGEPPSPSISEDDSSDSGYGSISSDNGTESVELYIPAPADASRQEAFQYHIGTRNYLAYLSAQPLVGESLGKALADLAHRIEIWQPEGVASTDFLDYCQEQGYLDFAENPDYAAASLHLAEEARIRDIWLDAFAHCVGLRDYLDNCPEAEGLSNTTKALIRRAALEMELHITRATAALGTFLEAELGPEVLGLTRPAREHLDRFRSCLHGFYAANTGYFPPDPNAPYNKRLWIILYEDFRCLYEYLADVQSSVNGASNRGLNGGICVLQNVHAFDERHGYSPLPHPVPLMPDMSMLSTKTSEVQKGVGGLRSFRLGRSDSQPRAAHQHHQQQQVTAKQALAQASNTTNPDIMENRLVQEYIRFERSKLEERGVSVSEARKIRWILVYCVLQVLISITRAPREVQDTETPSYPLCVPTHGCPPWMEPSRKSTMPPQVGVAELQGEEIRLSAEMEHVRRTLEEDRISIHPDCEAESAGDYFTMNGLSRSTSDVSMMVPSPLRMGPPLSRTASVLSSVNSLHRSVVGSFSRRNSSKRNSILFQPKEKSFCEIVLEGYGNGAQTPPEPQACWTPGQEPSAMEIAELEAPLPEGHHVPILELHQLETLNLSGGHKDEYVSPVDSQFSGFSSHCLSDGDISPIEEVSSASEFSSPRNSQTAPTADFSSFNFDFRNQDLATSSCEEHDDTSSTMTPQTYQPSRTRITMNKSLNVGTIMPSGFEAQRVASSESVCSMASSVYAENNIQAAEIEEEEVRGRRRLRGLDRVPKFGIVGGQVSLPQSPI